MHGQGFFEHVKEELARFLQGVDGVLFVPWALQDHDAYEKKVRPAFSDLGIELRSIHRQGHPLAAIGDAEAVFVGGGNTFRLLDHLQRTGAAAAIAARAMGGMRYIGSSAGTNVATRSIRTTNDMPIVQPATFTAMGLVPFQINPHYLDPDPGSRHMGETREERIRQFHEEDPTPVLGLREGAWVTVQRDKARLEGTTGARLFKRGEQPQELATGADLTPLLRI